MHLFPAEPLEARIAPAALSISNAQIAEGDPDSNPFTPDTVQMVFTVTLDVPSNQPTTFVVETRNGTAVQGEDFTDVVFPPGSNPPTRDTKFTIPAGQTSTTVPVTVRKDVSFEATESFFVEITEPSANVTVLDGEGRGTIYNDDLLRVDAQTVRYVDEDGDLATVRITQGVLTTGFNGAVLQFGAVNSIGGRILQTVDFTGDPLGHNHTDLFVTAGAQAGFSVSGGVSNGRVDVGFIRAGIPQGDTFQFVKNSDLNTVVIRGDLGKIVAGDVFADDRAVETLSVRSHGLRGTATGAPDNDSVFLGGAQFVKVRGDVQGRLAAIGSDRGDFEVLKIEGALRGGAEADSGQIFFTGTLGNATIGSIIGGAGTNSGTVLGNFNDDTIIGSAELGSLRVRGDIVGGSGESSGKVVAPTVNIVRVGSQAAPGDLIGGTGANSGVITAEIIHQTVVTGDILGGGGAGSGEVLATNGMGSVKVRGSVIGGPAADAGAIISSGGINSAIILKNLQGGAGERSGSVKSALTIKYLQIGSSTLEPDGNLIGSTGASSGLVQAGANLNVGLITGSILGGTANGSGGIEVNGTLGVVQIQKNLEGGSSSPGASLVKTGFISAGRVDRLLLDGDLKSGTNNGTSLVSSGTVRAVGDIASFIVSGGVIGNASARVVVSAGGQAFAAPHQTIASMSVKGDTAFADILGGYSPAASTGSPRGVPVDPDARMGTIKFGGAIAATNVAAGVAPGVDGRFGTADDAVITGTDDAALRSKIAKLIIKGTVATNAEIYGVVAQKIVAAKVNGVALALNPSGQDDLTLGTGNTNFRLHELPKPA